MRIGIDGRYIQDQYHGVGRYIYEVTAHLAANYPTCEVVVFYNGHYANSRFALQSLALCGITAQPPHREILKTALGATETVAWAYFETTQAALDYYQTQNYLLVGVEQTAASISLSTFKSQLLNQLNLEKLPPLALIFGNEVDGVSQTVLNQCHYAVEIPQFGTKHSLNVAVCVGIVAWEMVR